VSGVPTSTIERMPTMVGSSRARSVTVAVSAGPVASVTTVSQHAEGRLDRLLEVPPFGGELQAARFAYEELRADKVFQRDDLLGNRALRHTQLLRRARQIEMARCGLKGAYRVQRRHQLGHQRIGRGFVPTHKSVRAMRI
jgi:hypothetical protein